jgi:hypothetical protein
MWFPPCRFDIPVRWFHDLSVDGFAENNVSWREGRRHRQSVLSLKAWRRAAGLLIPVGNLMLLQVYSSGKGYDINIDNHRAGASLLVLALLLLML